MGIVEVDELIATSEYIDILDKADALSTMILQSEQVKAYRSAYQTLQNDKEAQRLIKAFSYMKEHYDDLQRFGHYHPDYHTIMKEVRSSKRKMDMNESVS